MPNLQDLSEREQEILGLLATGATNKEIALRLNISANTVKVHLRNIFTKIEVASRTEAVLFAIDSGLTSRAAPETAVKVRPPEQPFNELAAPPKDGAEPDEAAAGPAAAPAAGRPVPAWIQPGAWLALAAVVIALVLYVQSRSAPVEELPSPGTSTRWQTLAPLPEPRFGLALANYENQLYAVAGETASGVTARLERFDPQENAWEALADKPTAVSEVQAGLIGGQIYVPGGRLADGQFCDRLEIYDPRDNSWTQGAALPTPVSAYALVVYEGSLYVFGGRNNQGVLDGVYRYDPQADAWSQGPKMPTARAFLVGATLGGQIYLIGGYDGRRAVSANEMYTPDLEETSGGPWFEARSMPGGRYGMGAASLVDRILVVGGTGAQPGGLASLQFLPQSNAWLEFGSLGEQEWTDMGVAPLGAALYVVGGRIDGIPVGETLTYQAIYTNNMPVIR